MWKAEKQPKRKSTSGYIRFVFFAFFYTISLLFILGVKDRSLTYDFNILSIEGNTLLSFLLKNKCFTTNLIYKPTNVTK